MPAIGKTILPRKHFVALLLQKSDRGKQIFSVVICSGPTIPAGAKTALCKQLHIEASTALRRLQAACDRIPILRKIKKME
jgi:hypothetical protein